MTILLGYLLGSFPTAYIFGKRLTGKDIRRLGDGNMGARNAYHELGHKAGIIIFCIDAAKGVSIILFSKLFDISQGYMMLAGLATIAGHNFPVFLQFRGGRGEAVTIGILMALLPVESLIVAAPTIVSLLIWKNVILTSAVCFITMPVICWLFGVNGSMIAYVITMPVMVAITHFFRARGLRKTIGTGTT
ncbi:MAG: glycerol-3-phosphate acyltransferase [Dehalococcoidales bacterium]|nr:glycerol-3-phosphate acyltransferase [Dehalococcoidales bacterium]